MITVPPDVVGNPKSGDTLESVTSFTVLDNGNPPFVTAGAGNIPSIVDATPAYNVVLGSAPLAARTTPAPGPRVLGSKTTRKSLPATGIEDDPAIAIVLFASAAALTWWRRRQPRIH